VFQVPRADSAARQAQQEQRRAEAERRRETQARQRIDQNYQRGQESLERRAWARAVDSFTRVADAQNSTRVDAALYWKAYALDKLNQQADALTTVQDLIKRFPQSRWLSDARALELQVRQNAGQSPRPEAESDEELKLLAIQGLQRADPEQAVPMLEKLLQGTASPRLKSRALFVLAQSNSPRARQVLTAVAKGGSNPDVQRRAIQYLGTHGSRENRAILAEIYAGSGDVDIKRQILRAFMVSGDRARVLAAANTEKVPELRQDAVRLLGSMGAREELWQMYQKESAVEVKRQILQSLFVAGEAGRLVEVANSEPNPELRRRAVQHLGTMGRTKTGDALVGIYAKEKEADIKRLVVNALYVQGNADALVSIARKETDPALKRELVSKLSLMTKSKVAVDYLLEILNK
jgi:HEAT repeat protein